ncbi:MAG: hypothetical protein IJE02_05900 [Clostridia bacterium]|nr:hypothetical protein [Clostridia bacterium]
MELLLREREEFIKGMKLKASLSLRQRDDYYFGIEKAFDDAFNQYARREKKKYATEKKNLMEPIIDRLYIYFNSDEDVFDSCFTDCIDFSKQILNNNLYGVAQKFTNMSFKYLYCYSDANEFENKFQNCHMPLDKYTIKWVKSLKNKVINKKLGLISNAWANIDENLYKDIQNFITNTLNLNFKYTISFNKQSNETSCVLPKNKLYAEFIIWHQERINELYNIIERAENDFDRLGIKWI